MLYNNQSSKIIAVIIAILLVFAGFKVFLFYTFGICYYYASKITSILNDYIKPYYYNSFLVATMLVMIAISTLLLSVIY